MGRLFLYGGTAMTWLISIGFIVEFYHPEGGRWSHGMSENPGAIYDVGMVESLGEGRYRLINVQET